jgi:hypothetical protein
VAQLGRGVSALAIASGHATLAYAFLTLADRGSSIGAPLQFYGRTHTRLPARFNDTVSLSGALPRKRQSSDRIRPTKPRRSGGRRDVRSV